MLRITKKQIRPIAIAAIGTTTATTNSVNDVAAELSDFFESKTPGATLTTPREVAAAVAGDADNNVVTESLPPPETLTFSTKAHSDMPMKFANAWSALKEKAVGATSGGLVNENGVASVTGEFVLEPHFVESMDRGPVSVAVQAVKRRTGIGVLPLRYEVCLDAAAKSQPEQLGIPARVDAA